MTCHVVETTAGTEIVPVEVCPLTSAEALMPFVEGCPREVSETVTGYFARLSAPGYMDRTEWSGPFNWVTVDEVHKVWSFRQARELIRQLREDNPPPRHNRFSAIGGTDVYIDVCADQTEFPRETTERPRYE
jgi:hypothetical protein